MSSSKQVLGWMCGNLSDLIEQKLLARGETKLLALCKQAYKEIGDFEPSMNDVTCCLLELEMCRAEDVDAMAILLIERQRKISA